MAKHRAQRLGQLHAEVSAVFPLAALTGLPRTVADAQVEHLLSLPDRVTVHLLPESSLLLGIPGPFMLFTLPPNRQVVTSDHLEGSVVHPGASVGRAAEILRDALALALPPSLSTGALKEF